MKKDEFYYKKTSHLNSMKIISWNVNGIRAARKKTFDVFIKNENPDIICIQETKAKKNVLKESDVLIEGYELFWADGEKPGYSGVAIWVREGLEVLSVQNYINIQKFDGEGRTIVLETPDFYIINSYYPNGRDDLSRVDFKLEYSYAILHLANKLKLSKPVILTGDFNTAHKEIDIARPKENIVNTGFLPVERKFLDDLSDSGFIDCFRNLYPDEKDIYSWWSYRGGAKSRNVGWRIDYFWTFGITPVECLYIFTENSSDHCPVILKI